MAGREVLLVGAGLTSALTAALVRQAAPGARLTVWEKARGAGGRFATWRATGQPAASVDLGAQYLSPLGDEAAGPEFQALIAKGVIAPLAVGGLEGHAHPPGTEHYVAPAGASSVVKHFLSESGAVVQYSRRVAGVERGAAGRWRVTTECGADQEFDCVLLTAPVPQLLELGGDLPDLLEGAGLLPDLRQVEYSTRCVLGMSYHQPEELGVPWTARYVPDHPAIRFLSVDNLKRGRSELPTSVLVHSTVPWAARNLDLPLAEVKEELLAGVAALYPAWPAPTEVKALRWRYSQVRRPFPGGPGAVAAAPGLLLGGDAFALSSNFSGCLQSARRLAAAAGL